MSNSNSIWKEYDFEEKIKTILRRHANIEKMSWGSPYITAYQLAIEFSKSYPGTVNDLGWKVGGVQCGNRITLSKYIASQLSKRINSGEIKDIEANLLCCSNISNISFNSDNKTIRSTLVGSGSYLSMFRFVKK
jgi:hypothetical protein